MSELTLPPPRHKTLLNPSLQQSLNKSLKIPPLNIPKLIPQNQHLPLLIKFNSSHRKCLHILSHRFSHILLLKQYLILQFTITYRVKCQHTTHWYTQQTIIPVQKQHMLYLLLWITRKYLMSVTHQICHYCVTIITTCSHHLTTHPHWNRIATLLMLFHCVPHWTFGIFRSILIMNKHLRPHRNRYNPPQILIPLIIKLTHITWPKSQSRNSMFMLLKILHSSTISYINSKYTSPTIPHKQFPLPIIQYHRSQFMCTYISIHTHQFTRPHIPHLHRLRMQRHYTQQSRIK